VLAAIGAQRRRIDVHDELDRHDVRRGRPFGLDREIRLRHRHERIGASQRATRSLAGSRGRRRLRGNVGGVPVRRAAALAARPPRPLPRNLQRPHQHGSFIRP
jgi:hypothetical protein